MPGAKSLEMNQYYAFPQNQFWKIMFHLFDAEFSDDYGTRINFIKQNKIALGTSSKAVKERVVWIQKSKMKLIITYWN